MASALPAGAAFSYHWRACPESFASSYLTCSVFMSLALRLGKRVGVGEGVNVREGDWIGEIAGVGVSNASWRALVPSAMKTAKDTNAIKPPARYKYFLCFHQEKRCFSPAAATGFCFATAAGAGWFSEVCFTVESACSTFAAAVESVCFGAASVAGADEVTAFAGAATVTPIAFARRRSARKCDRCN